MDVEISGMLWKLREGDLQSLVCLEQGDRCREMWLTRTAGWAWPLGLRDTVFSRFPSGLSFLCASHREQDNFS